MMWPDMKKSLIPLGPTGSRGATLSGTSDPVSEMAHFQAEACLPGFVRKGIDLKVSRFGENLVVICLFEAFSSPCLLPGIAHMKG